MISHLTPIASADNSERTDSYKDLMRAIYIDILYRSIERTEVQLRSITC